MTDGRPIALGAAERRETPDGIEIAAAVDWHGDNPGFPERLWFRVPADHAAWLCDRCDPFLTAMAMVAMKRRRPLHVDGTASARLGAGLAEFAGHFATVAPQRFAAVPLHAAAWTREPALRGPGAVASTFSGGVDSFYTVFRHNVAADGANPASRITHAFFINGFDLRPGWPREMYDSYAAQIEPVLAGAGVRMLRIETNAREFMPYIDWIHMHGTVLAACAQTLGGLVGLLYVPSSTIAGGAWKAVWGTDPATDYLMGTETLQLVHDSVHLNRPDKMRAMREWRPFLDNMRVCLHPTPGRMNCGKCEKCIRTMVHLALAGMLDAPTTFPPEARRDMWRNASWVQPGISWDAWYMRGEALMRGRPDIARKLAFVHARDLLKRAKRRLMGQA